MRVNLIDLRAKLAFSQVIRRERWSCALFSFFYSIFERQPPARLLELNLRACIMPLFSYNKAGRFLSVRLARNNLSLLRHGGHRGFAIDWFRTKRSIKSCICPLIVVLASKTMSLCKFLMAKVWGHELLYEGITFKLPNFLQFSKRKQRVTSLAGTMYFSYCSVWAAFLFISSFCEISEPVIPPCLWANETVSENSTLQWVHG